MTNETILPELVGTLASLPEHTQKTIKAYGAACYRTALHSSEVQAWKRDNEWKSAIDPAVNGALSKEIKMDYEKEKEHEEFVDWLYLGQTEVEPNELNEKVVNCMWLAWQARQVYTWGSSNEPTDTPAHSMNKEVSQFLADVMTAAGLVSHGKQCKALGERLSKGCMNLRNKLAIPEQVQLKKEMK